MSGFYSGQILSAMPLNICPLRPKFVKWQQTIHTCKTIAMTKKIVAINNYFLLVRIGPSSLNFFVTCVCLVYLPLFLIISASLLQVSLQLFSSNFTLVEELVSYIELVPCFYFWSQDLHMFIWCGSVFGRVETVKRAFLCFWLVTRCKERVLEWVLQYAK